ncbi:PREDICTED: autophagy-related protein 9A isoform X1 [Polistes dominula]|uniref:Autophagy-related protein 9 n=2 Tax=Polistes dominula TaxID=743375 RepID=A0ABM1J8J5_POLDO|nr:PREDICTED: autophagy-related protein 9A isoform X1 [Polistes dominula]XP_015188792.1 PREDICTED: autophagy-related protein 9A isoform X1 [Polistes dominula]XP_015188801.1 PREDICTED: autophagy-related protein 9A isoform X1 [Polistes dominula]XP_015188807.1 PREDICTED: autophagy-related protein 9A isoform X1 [Polistes dominula]
MKRDTVITCVEPNRRAKTMTTILDGSYQQLESYDEGEGDGDNDNEQEETPQESAVMIHVVPEGNKARWNHIEDLDSFFMRMYHYHQKHGFKCMMLEEFFELLEIIFIVTLFTFLLHCVNYPVLLGYEDIQHKLTIPDVLFSSEECLASIGWATWFCILFAAIYLTLSILKVLYHLIKFWDIKLFFNEALKIDDADLDNFTWHEVQSRVIEVQKEQEMCIHKRELTELDIYHRILRFKNYEVAMINKSLLPLKFKVPIFGNITFLTKGLKYNIGLLLFWGPWSPFENNWHLKEEYKKLSKRQELARALSKQILWVGIANFLLCPLILLWQILHLIFSYGELVKNEPSTLGLRMWSPYGRLYLRHFNELDHELNVRLNRAYHPAQKYMNLFTSPTTTVVAKFFATTFGCLCFVTLLYGLIWNTIVHVDHMITIATFLSFVVIGARRLIPSENLVWCPDALLNGVLAHIHYSPDSWRDTAHTQKTRAQVAVLFQHTIVHLLEELISPLVTPFILCFRIRRRALEIVDFFRNFTIQVTGVGDVCSFAQMDIRKHGNPAWQTVDQNPINNRNTGYDNPACNINIGKFDVKEPAEDGKTELSLIHFTLTNPEWKPPSHAENFVTALRERAKKDINNVQTVENPMITSLTNVSDLGPQYDGIVSNLFRSMTNQQSVPNMSSALNYQSDGNFGVSNPNYSASTSQSIPRYQYYGVTRAEGPLYSDKRFMYGLQQSISNNSLGGSIFGSGNEVVINKSVPTDLIAADMSLSTLYLHELHHKQVYDRGSHQERSTRNVWLRSPVQELETLSEVRQERAPLLSHQDSSIRINKES